MPENDASGIVESNAARLETHTVHVWVARLSRHVSHLATYLASLDATERVRADRFRFAADRAQYIVAHGLTRAVLGVYAGAAPETLGFEPGPYGKPAIRFPAGGRAPLQFNLSHSGDLIAIAVSPGRMVGVDVEQWAPAEYDEICESFFSMAERQALRALPPADKARAFFACWTRKEAYIKATGLGVSQGLDYFDVSFVPDQPVRLLADRRDRASTDRWTMTALDLPNGYSGAAVAQGSDGGFEQYELSPEAVGLR